MCAMLSLMHVGWVYVMWGIEVRKGEMNVFGMLSGQDLG